MAEQLHGVHYKPQQRYNKTSADQRRSLRSQVGTRAMGRTGGLQRSSQQEDVIQEENEVNDIIESYRIEEEIMPRMRMKWKSGG